MGILSNTGLLPCPTKEVIDKRKNETPILDLRCDVSPAPFILRPYAALYNPFPNRCSVLCNHPVDTEAKEFFKKTRDAWITDGKSGNPLHEELLSKVQNGQDKDKNKIPYDIVTEDMFRRYAETDSRPLTPAPTLASGKSRGSRRCLTPDHPPPKTTIVVDLRRSHSQETLYYHGYATSDLTTGHTTSPTNDRSTLPSLNLSDATHARLLKGQTEQLPPLASPLVLAKRAEKPPKEPNSVRAKRVKITRPESASCVKRPPSSTPSPPPLRRRRVKSAKPQPKPIAKPQPKPIAKPVSESSESSDVSSVQLSSSIFKLVSSDLGKFPTRSSLKVHFALTPSVYVMSSRSETQVSPKKTGSKFDLTRILTASGHFSPFVRSKLLVEVREIYRREANLQNSDLIDSYNSARQNQLKALNLNKGGKGKGKGASGDAPSSQRSKTDKSEKEGVDDSELGGVENDDNGSIERRRGKRRRKGRQSDRLTSAGLAAQSQQDPETQIAGIGTDSHNPSSRGSIAPQADDDVIPLPVIKPAKSRKVDSFLDDEMLKFLHREVDEEAIETEFDTKRRYVLAEALRTRPDRPVGVEMQTLLREMKVPAVSLGDWLHIPRLFSRQNAQFSLPLDSNALEDLTPMQYAARFVTLKRSKQLLYLTVLRKFRPEGYMMPKKDIEEGLILMMGGTLSEEQARRFKVLMEWEDFLDEDHNSDDIKLALLDEASNRKHALEGGDTGDTKINSLKYRTWCGLCAVCERVYGRFPPREIDPPDGIEISDFSMLETKLTILKVHNGLVEILNAIRLR